MKNQLLTISATAIFLLAGQSAIAIDYNLFTLSHLDFEPINQVSDTRSVGDADLMKASILNSRVQGNDTYEASEGPFSLDSSN